MEYDEIPNFSTYLDKMKMNQLTLEDILSEDAIITDIKTNEHSDFLPFFTNEQIKKLIDYSTRFPKSDNYLIGYKYPFNSTEILCSETTSFQNILMNETKLDENKMKKNLASKFTKNIHKGGFFETFFKALKKAENENNNEEEIDINNLWNDNSLSDYNEEEDNNNKNNNESNDNNGYNNMNDYNNVIFNYYRSSINNIQGNQNKDKVIYENIDYLLEFLRESEETRQNYVLDGYFYRILSNIISMDNNSKIINYLLNYPKKDEFDVLDFFVKNMRRKSKNMFNIVQKLLQFKEDNNEDIYSSTHLKKDLKEKKITLLKKILKELDNTEDQEKYECICDSLCSLMNNNTFFENEFDNLNPLETLYKILSNCKNNNKKAIYITKLLIKINENILKLFDSRCTPVTEEDNNENYDTINIYNNYNYNNFNAYGIRSSGIPEDNKSAILEKVLLNLFTILEKNKFDFLDDLSDYNMQQNNEFMSTYLLPQKKIGLKKIVEIEYIKSLLDIFINACYSEYHSEKIEDLIIIANDKNIFWNLHNLFFLYPISNIYQIYYSQIIDVVININSPKILIDNFFINNEKNYLTDIFIEKILADSKFEFKLSNNTVLSPIFSFVVNILNKINATENLYLSKNYLKNNSNFEIFIEIFGTEVNDIFNQKLLLSKNYQGFNFGESDEEKISYFPKKSYMELLEEDLNIYDKYKKGEDYKKILEEKKNRVEKEKEEKQKLNEKPEPKKVEYIDDLEEEDDPLFKIEKINLQHDKENFLALLNKPTEEVNKIMNEQNNEIKNENNGNINDNEIDIKELEFEDDNNDDMNLKVNEDLDPNKIMENKIYNINNNKKEEEDNDNTEKEKDLNNKDDNKDEDDIVDI